jgi:CubicO group peptidase (beta-lactamase class C family)
VARRHPIRLRALAGVLALQACRASGPAASREAPAGEGARAVLVGRIDSLVQAFRIENRVPGASVAVVRGSDTLLMKGVGLADVEDSAPATPATVYRIGSITKQFTAGAILRLVEQGKMRLDAPISTYLPDFPDPGRRATVRQLLTHTSGIPNYTELANFPDKRRTDLTDAQLLALVDHLPLDFRPGTRWHYSNSGFYILGVILQRLVGEPYGAYVERTITGPLGLTDTRYCDVLPIIPRRAAGYSLHGDTLVNASYLSMRLPGAAGGLCSTVGDLLRWQGDLVHGRVVAPATYRAMTTAVVLADGKPTTYGFALGVYALHGRPAVEHSGGINGFSADLAYYPSDSLSVVVLLNTDAASAARLARRIAEMALGMGDAGPLDLAVPPADQARYVGTYATPGGKAHVEVRGGRLTLVDDRPRALRSQGADRFVPEEDHDVSVLFHVVGDRARSVTITEPEGTASELQRVP